MNPYFIVEHPEFGTFTGEYDGGRPLFQWGGRRSNEDDAYRYATAEAAWDAIHRWCEEAAASAIAIDCEVRLSRDRAGTTWTKVPDPRVASMGLPPDARLHNYEPIGSDESELPPCSCGRSWDDPIHDTPESEITNSRIAMKVALRLLYDNPEAATAMLQGALAYGDRRAGREV